VILYLFKETSCSFTADTNITNSTDIIFLHYHIQDLILGGVLKKIHLTKTTVYYVD
jgi:hypothetical protein